MAFSNILYENFESKKNDFITGFLFYIEDTIGYNYEQ